MTTDNSELLRSYLADRSEAAFAQLVERNIDLVYSAALRQVSGDTAAAQDVTQAVFTDLARKAPALARHTSITGWLYTSTRYLAARTARSEKRRRAREEKAFAMNAPLSDPESTPAWEELQPVLDDVLHELKEEDREAILMRFYESRHHGEIGLRLGLSENAARMRIERALEKMRQALKRRGIESTVSVLTVLLTVNFATAAPAGLAARVTQSAMQAASYGVLMTLLAWFASYKVQILGGGLATAVLLGFFSFLWNPPQEAKSSVKRTIASYEPVHAVNTNDSSVQASNEVSNTTPAPLNSDDTNRLVLTIVAEDSGKPIPNVQVKYWIWEGSKISPRKPQQANRFGVCEIAIPRATLTRLVMVTASDGFADTRIQWSRDAGESIPETYEAKVARAVPLGGKVVDADGQPVSGAEVGFNNDPGAALEGVSPQTDNFSWPFWVTAKTDREGHWSMSRVATNALRNLYGSARHPEHVGSDMIWLNRDNGARDELVRGAHVFRLGRAVTVTGSVVDSEGKPVADAAVLVGRVSESGSRKGKTGANGHFEIVGCQPGENSISVSAQGFAPVTRAATLKSDSDPFHIVLVEGKTLRLRVVNRAGEPVPNATVWLDTFSRGLLSEKRPTPPQVEFNRRTGPDGRIEWKGAPDQELTFAIRASGHMRVQDIRVKPDGQEHVVTLPHGLTISGTVSDSATGQPIPKFRIIAGWPQISPFQHTTNFTWSSVDRFWLAFTDGKFRHVFEEPVVSGTSNIAFGFKFEAEGYMPVISRAVNLEEESARFDVVMDRAESIEVQVLQPDGRAASGVDIGLKQQGSRLQLTPGGLSRDMLTSATSLLISDKAGRFILPNDPSIAGVIAAGAEGFGEFTVEVLKSHPVLQLQPWGAVEGKYINQGKPAADHEVFLDYAIQDQLHFHTDPQGYRTKADSAGRFHFPQVPPGTHRLLKPVPLQGVPGVPTTFKLLQTVEVRSGETTQVNLGGDNCTVTVRLRWPATLIRKQSWNVAAMLQTPLPAFPPGNDPQAMAAWHAQPEIKAALKAMRHFVLKANSDGSFSVEDVPPGEYNFMATVVESRDTPGPMTVHASAKIPVKIPSNLSSGQFDLGEVELKAAQ